MPQDSVGAHGRPRRRRSAPGSRSRDRRHPPGREAARDDVPGRRRAPDARVRRPLRDPADHQLRAATPTIARNGWASAASRSSTGSSTTRARTRSSSRSPRSCDLDRRVADARMIPYGRQDIDEADIAAVVDGAAVRLPDPGPDGAALRAGGRGLRAARRTRWRSTTPPPRCTSPASRSGWALASVCGPSPNTFVASANCAPLLRRRGRLRRHRPAHLQPER